MGVSEQELQSRTSYFNPEVPYLVEELIQGAIGHELGDDAEELGLVAHTKDLDDVVEPGFVKHLGLFQ